MEYLNYTVIIFIVSIIITFIILQKRIIVNGEGKYYYQDGEITDVVKKIFHNNGYKKINDLNKAYIYEPCDYDHIESKLTKLYNNKYIPKYINGISGCDLFVSKSGLWKILKNYYGIEKAQEYVPKTFLFDDPYIYNQICLEPTNSIFIAKKDEQRQNGIKLFKKHEITVNIINELRNSGYVVLQKYLKDPYLIDNRKTNMRIYVFIVLQNNSKKVYMFNDGFMYYTKKSYKYNTDIDSGITTGYIDRKVYEHNPLTHNDLKVYLKNKGENPDILFNNIKKTIKGVMIPVLQKINNKNNCINYQLFGIDVQSDPNLNIKLIEINKSPSLVSMDLRDSELKAKVQKGYYSLINLHNEHKDDYISII
jgi:hypothetical protein